MVRDGRGLPHVATAFTAFNGEQMTFTAFLAGDLACSRDFQPFGDPFVCFAFRCFSCFSWYCLMLFGFFSIYVRFHPSFSKAGMRNAYIYQKIT